MALPDIPTCIGTYRHRFIRTYTHVHQSCQQGQFLLQHSIDLRVRYRNSSNETINMLLLTCGTPSGHAFTSQSKTLISNKTLDMTWQVLNHSSRIIAACSQAPSSARNSPKSRPYPSLLVKVSHWYKKKHLFIFIYIDICCPRKHGPVFGWIPRLHFPASMRTWPDVPRWAKIINPVTCNIDIAYSC